ncbi:sonic hedgehog, partial [Paramuricea clavata]
RLVGQGYNILTDKSVATQVMKFDVTKTQYGIAIPKCVKFEKVQQTRSSMDQFENDESYTQSRLVNLNVSLNVEQNVMAGCRAGCNKSNNSTSSTSEFSFLFEQRMFEIKIGNYKESLNNGMTFTSDFESDVANLPSTYNKSEPSCRSHFERFFNRFGHFLVSSAFGGGSVEIKCSRETIGGTSASLEEAKASLTAACEGVDVEFNAGSSSSDDMNAKALLNRCTHSWEGGDMALQAKETIADKEKMQKWKASLLVNPMMLTSEMTLEPISTGVACVDPKKDQTTYDALKDLLGGEFKVLAEEEKQKRAADESAKKMEEANTRQASAQQPEQSGGGGCFPSSLLVNIQNKDGVVKQKKMVKLEVGDKIMGWDEKRNRAIFTEVIMFAHRASDAMDVEYLKIALEDGNKITLTGNHLIMVGKHKKAILAQKVKPGEILFTVDENREISPKKVLAVDKVIEQGVYCPFTVHGNLIVDNVLASCYASVQDHVFLEGLVKISAQSIAHFGLVPMRALHKLRFKWWKKIPNGQTMHPYLQWLCKLKLPWQINMLEK